MSYTEVKDREGFPYGGMPNDTILYKLEESGSADNVMSQYDDHVRREIIDWSLETPFLESDKTRRDPSLGKSILNLHYNGTRGSRPELPRHPELFYGFTGNDPRGVDNTPRFDQVRGQMSSRAADVTVRMGNNDDNHIAERPWTGQAISYGKKYMQKELKKNTKVFTVQKEGRPFGRNVVFNDNGGANLIVPDADEGLYNGDYNTDGVRGVDRVQDTAFYRNTDMETDMGKTMKGQTRGAGRNQMEFKFIKNAEHDWDDSEINQKMVTKVMASIVGFMKNQRRTDQEQDPGNSETNMIMGKQAMQQVIQSAYRHIQEEQRRTSHNDNQMTGGGLKPANDISGIFRHSAYHTDPNMSNIAMIAKGLKEGSASGRRKIMDHISMDHQRDTTGEKYYGAKKGAPPAFNTNITSKSEADLVTSAASKGLSIHSYKSFVPSTIMPTADIFKSGDDYKWQNAHTTQLGSTKLPEWRSSTQGQTLVDNPWDRINAVSGSSGGLMGNKSIRNDRMAPNTMDDPISGNRTFGLQDNDFGNMA